MSHASDISNLYQRVDANPDQYRELEEARQAKISRERWPMMSAVRPDELWVRPVRDDLWLAKHAPAPTGLDLPASVEPSRVALPVVEAPAPTAAVVRLTVAQPPIAQPTAVPPSVAPSVITPAPVVRPRIVPPPVVRALAEQAAVSHTAVVQAPTGTQIAAAVSVTLETTASSKLSSLFARLEREPSEQASPKPSTGNEI